MDRVLGERTALKTGLSGLGTQAWSCQGACPRGTKEIEPKNGGRNCSLSPDDLKHLDQTIPAYRCRKHPFLLQLLRFFFHCDKRWPFHDHLLTPEHVSPGASLPTMTPLYPQGSDKYNFFHHISRHNRSSFQAHHTPTLEESLLEATSSDGETEAHSRAYHIESS